MRSVWPHRITLGLAGRAVVVATDSGEVAARLRPWRIDDVAGPVDYYLDLHPPVAAGADGPPLPGLWHGAEPLVRAAETDRLAQTLLRVLASHERPAGVGQVRLELAPLARGSTHVLVPPRVVSELQEDSLRAAGIDAIRGVSSLLDAPTARVLLDPPLGSADETAAPLLGAWLIPTWSTPEALTPGLAVAELMQLAIGVTVDNAQATLAAVASLVERVHPRPAPVDVDTALDAVELAFDEADRRAGDGG